MSWPRVLLLSLLVANLGLAAVHLAMGNPWSALAGVVAASALALLPPA